MRGLAMGRGQLATLARPGTADAADEDHEQPPDKAAVAVESEGFNLHAGMRIEARDDLGRERLARYALLPTLLVPARRTREGGIPIIRIYGIELRCSRAP